MQAKIKNIHISPFLADEGLAFTANLILREVRLFTPPGGGESAYIQAKTCLSKFLAVFGLFESTSKKIEEPFSDKCIELGRDR